MSSKPMTRARGHADAELVRDPEHRDRRQVVRREDRRRAVHLREQPLRELPRGVLLVAAHPDEAGLEPDAGFEQRTAVARVAQDGRAEVGATGDEADAGVTELDQVARRELRAVEAVGFDRRQVGRPGVRVDRDDRHFARDVHDGRGDHDDAVDERAAQPADRAPLPPLAGAVLRAGVGHEVEPRTAHRGPDTLEDLCAERLESRHEHADHTRAVRAHAARAEAGLVAQPLHDVEHAAHGVGRDAVAAVDGLGDGRDRNAGGGGDVVDRGSASHGRDDNEWKRFSKTFDTATNTLRH